MTESLYLVKVEAGENNNKYYRMTKNGDVFDVEYGRIGASGKQTMQYPISKWDSQLKSKLKKGYEDQTRLVAVNITKQKSKDYKEIINKAISSIVERLISMAKQAIKDNYTISSTAVTQTMVDEAQEILGKLNDAKSVEEFNKHLMTLFRTIPRKMARVSDCLATSDKEFGKIAQKEQDLLDVMRGQVVQETVTVTTEESDELKPEKTILETMGLEFEEVDANDIAIIKKELKENSHRFHKAWKVKNNKAHEKFDNFVEQNKIKDVKLLFHGTRSENIWSILCNSLVLRPNAVITGKLYGNGVYFAPKAQKSLGYTSLSGSYWVNGSEKSGFMFLCEVAYGTPYDVYDFNSKYYNLDWNSLQSFKNGAHSLHAHAGASLGNSSLRNDEIIVYKEEQIKFKYLIELR